MHRLLTIGEAAELLGLQVDTVRKLERAGRIRAVRTEGGHRRFTPEEIDRYRTGSRRGSAAKPLRRGPARRENPAREPARHPATGEFTARPPAPQAYAAPTSPQPTPPADPSIPRPASDSFEAYRLQGIKEQGMAAIPWGTPAEWQGKVIAELERFVTPIQFPVSLWANKASEVVRVRVAEVLRPYHEAQEKAEHERKAADEKAVQDFRLKMESDRRRSALLSHGSRYAWRETLSWDMRRGARPALRLSASSPVTLSTTIPTWRSSPLWTTCSTSGKTMTTMTSGIRRTNLGIHRENLGTGGACFPDWVPDFSAEVAGRISCVQFQPAITASNSSGQ